MFSIIIATHDSERALVATLAALVPGATAGIVREVVIADGGSADETEQVADIAGCVFLSSKRPLGVRLTEAAGRARGTWLMFLEPGVVPGLAWIDEVHAFVEQTERDVDRVRAAVFASTDHSFPALFRRAFGLLPRGEQGLMIPKSLYEALGGHPNANDPETGLLHRIGRRRLATLRTSITKTDI